MLFLLGDAARGLCPAAQQPVPLQPPPKRGAPAPFRSPGPQPGFARHPPRPRRAAAGPSAPRPPALLPARFGAARRGAVRCGAGGCSPPAPAPAPAPPDKSGGVRRRETDCAAIGGGGARRAPVGPGAAGAGAGALTPARGRWGGGAAPRRRLCARRQPGQRRRLPPPPSAPRGAAGGSAPLRSAPHHTAPRRPAPRYVCRCSPASSRPLPSRRGAPGPALRARRGRERAERSPDVPPGAEKGARRHAGPGAGAEAGAAAGRGVAGVRAERDGAHRAGGEVPRGVRLQPHLRPHRHGARHLRALGQRQGRLFRHPQHQPRTLRDEQPHHDHLLRPGTSEHRQQLRLGAEHFHLAQERDLQF